MNEQNGNAGFQPDLASFLLQNRGIQNYGGQNAASLVLKALDPQQLLTVDPLANNAPDSQTYDIGFGQEVWSALNNVCGTFNALPQLLLNGQSGATYTWRLLVGRGNSTANVSETGSLPTGTQSEYFRIGFNVDFIATRIGTTLKHSLISKLSVSGIDDAYQMELRNKQLEHVVEINRRLVAPGFFFVSGVTADGSFWKS